LSYQIQVSNDNTNWTTIYSTTSGVGGVETFPVSGSGRYVRMYGTARGTAYGYSLYEFGIYS
jgi:F5/8 type C domain